MRLMPWRTGSKRSEASDAKVVVANDVSSQQLDREPPGDESKRASQKLIGGEPKKRSLSGSRGVKVAARGFERVGKTRVRATAAMLAMMFLASVGAAQSATPRDVPAMAPRPAPITVLQPSPPQTLFELRLGPLPLPSASAPVERFAAGEARAECRVDANRAHPAPQPPASGPDRGPQFPVDGGRYNIGYDPAWNIFDQDQHPEHNSDFTGDRPSNASHPTGHHGVDVFAPEGTPIVAPVAGVIVRFGWDTSGGNRVWLHDPAANQYYYFAHLDSFAGDLAVGKHVEAGATLGTLGDTGSAQGTAPHLHFERHPGSADNSAVDPFDQLVHWSEVEEAHAREDAQRAAEHRNAVAAHEAVVAIDTSLCTLVAALEADPASFGGTLDGSEYHLTEDSLREAGRKLGLDEGATHALIAQLGVLGYANGAPNSVASSVTIHDLQEIRDLIQGGKSFDQVVQIAQAERDETISRNVPERIG
jgi:murein DD-endopeptidase MepM/ murein hydrolase activator NlpD